MALFQRIRPSSAENTTEEETGPRPGPRSAGDVLRQRRAELGLNLGEISASLKIRPAYLAALEEGRPDRLPGPAYAAGFVRAYGEHLGLDGGEILRRFRAESGALDAKPDLSFPMPLGERGIPGGSMLLAALILALCGYGTWYYLSDNERSRPERVTEVPVDLLPQKAMPAAANQTPAAKPDGVAPPAEARPGNDANRAHSQPPSTVTTPGAATADLAPPASSSGTTEPSPVTGPGNGAKDTLAAAAQAEGRAGVGEGRARIVLRATADSWIAVRGADQAVLFTHLLKAGEIYEVPDQPGMSLRTGNAGGLDITVDGKPAPSIGPDGAVRRNVALDPQALMTGAAVRN